MIKKLASLILPLIFVVGALSDILTWFNITPAHIRNNKFVSGLIIFLNFKIPVYLISLIVLIAIFLYKYKTVNMKEKKPLSVEKKIEENKQSRVETIKEDKIAETLSKEQKYLLLRLLEQGSKKRYRYLVADDYKNTLRKTTADFNIVEAKLKDLDLIYVRSGVQGNYWELAEKGLKVAGVVYSQTKL